MHYSKQVNLLFTPLLHPQHLDNSGSRKESSPSSLTLILYPAVGGHLSLQSKRCPFFLDDKWPKTTRSKRARGRDHLELAMYVYQLSPTSQSQSLISHHRIQSCKVSVLGFVEEADD